MKLLIIEDDNFFQKFYSSKLTDDGYTIEVAENGEVGMTKISTFMPDVILLDIIMPQMNGFEVLKAMTEKDLLQKIPVIVFSTLGNEEDVKKALALGASTFVDKSFFDYDKLKSTIATLIKK